MAKDKKREQLTSDNLFRPGEKERLRNQGGPAELPNPADLLRRLAEEKFSEQSGQTPLPLSQENQLKLLHELQVHQIELEIQNAEIVKTRDDLATLLEKYIDLYDFAPVGYATLDRKGIIQDVNLTGSKLLGVEPSHLIGRRFGQFLTNEDAPTLTALLDKIFTDPAPAIESCEIMLKKEEHRPFFVQIEVLASRSGQECRVAIIDISQRKRLEETLKILHAELSTRTGELEATNVELEAFTSTVSHDLRQPLVLISCYAQILEDMCDDQIDERFREYLQEIHESTMQMGRRIDFLLQFSRLAHCEICRKTVDLSTMAKTLASELKLTSPERHVRFLCGDGISVTADPELCRLVLENLIGNAWKFTGDQTETVIEFGTTKIEGTRVYFVKDNGPGFAMADAERLFKPFQRHSSIKVEGYGIGLSTVQRIIQRHGGRVWAESGQGKGATFFFTLE